LELTRSGRFDAASFWYFSEDRNEDFIHVGPVGQDRLVFFIHSSTPVVDWQDLPDLRQYSFGAVAGYTYTKRFWQLGQDGVLTIQIAPSDEANLRKLRAGRIDLYPMSEDGGWHLIETLFGADATSDFGVLTTPLDVTEAYLLVSRKIAEADTIAKRLQAALDTLTEGNGQQIAEGQSKQ
jgi:polar amino acid transport system substrate-binding protein